MLKPPVEIFRHGYGPEMHGAKTVLCSWTLVIEDIQGRAQSFLFHLVEGDDPLLIGEDVVRKGKVDNIENLFLLQQPDGGFNSFHTYYDAVEVEGDFQLQYQLVPLRERLSPILRLALGGFRACCRTVSPRSFTGTLTRQFKR